MLTSMTPAGGREYLRGYERVSAETLETWAGRPVTSKTFYGRNTPRTQAGTCDPQRVETMLLTWYGGSAPVLDLAHRYGKEGLFRHLNEAAKLAILWYPPWFEQWGKPPGEDARIPGVCGDTWEALIKGNHHGDTDIKRHHDAYGLLVAMVTKEVRDFGGITDDDVYAFAMRLLVWIESRASDIVERRVEWLRYGNDINTICGLVRVFDKLGKVHERNRAYARLSAFVRFLFSDETLLSVTGADGKPWADWNYGPMVTRDGGRTYHEPFSYGWYPFGMQAWYRGHLEIALAHTVLAAVTAGDASLVAVAARAIDVLTRWTDPTRREGAPLAPWEPGESSPMFHNSCLAGGFLDPSRTFLNAGEADTTLADWARLRPDERFRRYAWADSGVGVWKMDGGYWKTDYRDPGGTVHQRRHDSGSVNVYVPRLPGMEAANGYETVDGLFSRAVVHGDPVLEKFWWIVVAQHLAFANTSDTVVEMRKALPGIAEGANLVGKPGRTCAWMIQCGWLGRSYLLGADAGGNVVPGAFAAVSDAATEMRAAVAA